MNLLLVDDQAMVLYGLLQGIDFEALGFTGVFTANNAVDALKICDEQPIDVIVSDIEMPKKNGLELLSEVHERYPVVLRIVLTSHPVFSYAQEGLKQGIFDYIVQPAPYREIENSLRRAAQAVQQSINARKLSAYGNLFKQHEKEFLTSIVSSLYLNNPEDVAENIYLINQSGYTFSMDSHVQLLWIDLFSYSHKYQGAPTKHIVLTALNEIFEELPELSAYTFFITENAHQVFSVFFISPVSMVSDLSVETLAVLESKLNDRLHSPCALYSSGLFRYRDIDTIIQHARLVISNNIANESGIHFINKASSDANIGSTVSGHLKHWDVLLRSGQMTMLRQDILYCLQQMSKLAKNKYQSICKIHQQILMLFFRYFYDNNIDTAALLTGDHSYRRLMDRHASVEDILNMTDFLIEAVSSLDHTQAEQADYFTNAKLYIFKHYNEDISVKAVSEYVHLNPEYFTRLFKKETGMTIIDFITNCRLSMAQDLLQNTNLTISMIASEIGYSSFSHFTQMFKRATGMTPSQYRALQSGLPSSEAENL